MKPTCDETYSMQSSNLESMGIKPSLFTDNVEEFSFCNVPIITHDRNIINAYRNMKTTKHNVENNKNVKCSIKKSLCKGIDHILKQNRTPLFVITRIHMYSTTRFLLYIS